MDIHVGAEPDDFLTGGAILCLRNITYGALKTGRKRCEQDVLGTYVTIDNLVHIASDLYSPDYQKCLNLCEVRVFVTGKCY